MRVLIVDDEPLARERLRRLCGDCNGIDVVGDAADGPAALQLSASLHPDIVLLDVRMPGMDGIEVARHLSAYDPAPAVIFTTAYNDYALEAFNVHAVGYLLKPVRLEKLQETLQSATRVTRIQLGALQQSETQAGASGSTRTHISARVRGNLVLIPVADVIYFQADQKYVTVRYAQGEVLIEESLKELEQEFGARFVRVHRNAMICLNCVQSLERDAMGSMVVGFRGIADKLEVSRRHLAELREMLKSL